MQRTSRLALISIALFFVACGGGPSPTATPLTVTLLTQAQPVDACDDALATGTLVPNLQSGLGLQSPDGQLTPVMWPFGYSALYADDVLQLVEESGNVVAVEGNVISMGGGFGAGNLFHACPGSIQRV